MLQMGGDLAGTKHSNAAVRAANHAGRTSKRRLESLPGTAGNAPLLAEITAFVEGQLHAIERQFPAVNVNARSPVQHGSPSPVLRRYASERTTALQHHVLGQHAAANAEEKKRNARLAVFVQSQRMFAGCFPAYKLFLDAITDEHLMHNRFLEDDLAAHTHMIAALQQDAALVEQEHAAAVVALEAQVADARDELDRERYRNGKVRGLLNDASAKDRNKETDVKRQLQDLEAKYQAALVDNKQLRGDVDGLARMNEHLNITTFSDALDSANQQLHEWRNQCGKKDEQLMECHDDLAAVLRDVRAVVAFFNSKSAEPLGTDDVPLSNATLRVLFPEDARKMVKRTDK
jgi:hypothetical protein